MNELIFAVKHLKTNKLYLLIEDGLVGDRLKVVAPGGDVAILPQAMFDEDYLELNEQMLVKDFDVKQVENFRAAVAEKNAEEDQDLEERQKRQKILAKADERIEVQVMPSRDSRAPATRRSSSSSTKKKGGLAGIDWQGDRLIFYRHKIEPLSENGIMNMQIAGRRFRISKVQFERIFNDVIMSRQYQSQGFYSFEQIPERLFPFEVPQR